tara:strand:- start:399 stop:1076 length:678 start_codon:yes stop_codon:yes gene_type:complete
MRYNLFSKQVKAPKLIHQIFYVWGDKEMNQLFKRSKFEFESIKGYKYKLWSEEECEELLNKFPDYVGLYYSCKYEIMKVDIIRFLILYKYGGLYADLDVIPVIKEFPESSFAVSKNDDELNIEVLLSCDKNPILLDYLDFVKEQIEIKNQIDVYKDWKLRYVHQTTGPRSFSRFLRNKDYDILKLNKPGNTNQKNPKLNLKGDEDYISYPSCSYSESFGIKNYAK